MRYLSGDVGHQVGFEPIIPVLREIRPSGVWRPPESTKGAEGAKKKRDYEYIPHSTGIRIRIRILNSLSVILPIITALEARKMQFPEPHCLQTFYLMHDCLRAKGV